MKWKKKRWKARGWDDFEKRNVTILTRTVIIRLLLLNCDVIVVTTFDVDPLWLFDYRYTICEGKFFELNVNEFRIDVSFSFLFPTSTKSESILREFSVIGFKKMLKMLILIEFFYRIVWTNYRLVINQESVRDREIEMRSKTFWSVYDVRSLFRTDRILNYWYTFFWFWFSFCT